MSFADHVADAWPSLVSEFGGQASYLPTSAVDAFDIDYIERRPNPFEEATPANIRNIVVLASDFTVAPVVGDTVTIGTTAYNVGDWSSNGAGQYRIRLQQF